MTEDASHPGGKPRGRAYRDERGPAVLQRLRDKGALVSCNECSGNEFHYVGHSTDAVIILTPDPLRLDELLPQTRSYKVHVVECVGCSILKTFLDAD